MEGSAYGKHVPISCAEECRKYQLHTSSRVCTLKTWHYAKWFRAYEALFTRRRVEQAQCTSVIVRHSPLCYLPEIGHTFGNDWVRIAGDIFLRTYILQKRLNVPCFPSACYSRDLMQSIPATACQNMRFIYDGALIDFAVRNHLYATYPGKWIIEDGPIVWLPRSPKLNPLDFFLWDHLKSVVYKTFMNTLENLAARIVVASVDIDNKQDIFDRSRPFFIRRCRLCNDFHGHNFEQSL